MAAHRITHIRKPNRNSTHEHITHVANLVVTPNWIETRENIIQYIDNKTHTFYVSENGKRSEVGVVRPGNGRDPYLRTYADNVWNDNLLALPEC